MWETKTPFVSHIIALHNNINIQQTLIRAANDIIEQSIDIKNLIVIRPKSKKKNTQSIDDIIKNISNGQYTILNLEEYTYKDYIWTYCIDDEFKIKTLPDTIDFYTHQELDDGNKIHISAVDTLYEQLISEQDYSAHFVIGSGGIGKTSLCLSLVKKLIENQSDCLTLFIRAEDIRKHIETNNITPSEINNIFDIYELQAKYLNHSILFDKKTLELAIVCGSIIIVIDGLDELSSIFRENFDINKFLKSISNIHTELGTSKIILTSRDSNLIISDKFSEFNIKKYELLGFKQRNCENYISKRFNRYDNVDNIIKKIMEQVECTLLKGGERIVPFFVDVISNIFEDNISTEDERLDFNFDNSKTPYPSLNELVDKIIFSIFEREKVRHTSSIEPTEMVELFCTLNIEIGDHWRNQNLYETLTILYDERGDELFYSIKQNPLLISKKDSISFKYDFLHSYFNSLFLFNNYKEKNYPSSDLLKLLSRLTIDSSEFKDLKKFFSNNQDIFISSSKKLIQYIKKSIINSESNESKIYKNTIEVIICLLYSIKSGGRNSFTHDVKSLYDIGTTNLIEGLYIKGDVPAFDFTDLKVSQSGFRKYPKFLNSTFTNSEFMYSKFDQCHNDSYRNTNIREAKIDKNTCMINDLSLTYIMLDENSKTTERQLLDEANKFLSSFYKGSSFRDNNKVHIRFSNIVPGLNANSFNKIIAKNQFIIVNKEKEIDTFYAIENSFKTSVRKFLNDGYKDIKIMDFLRFINK